ncbi:unnamed protein product [Ilex paraguariensis]|uniref:Uncharacterized protein n=1 Tax=Ilex paraguariensis TaxID=185542 RepID=A0ABC8SQM1_9AQUA
MVMLEDDKLQYEHDIRTGTIWTSIAHIITAMIGAVVTYISTSLISDCNRSPHLVIGTQNSSYMDAIRVIIGSNRPIYLPPL